METEDLNDPKEPEHEINNASGIVKLRIIRKCRPKAILSRF